MLYLYSLTFAFAFLPKGLDLFLPKIVLFLELHFWFVRQIVVFMSCVKYHPCY